MPVEVTSDGALDGISHSLEVFYGTVGKPNYEKIKQVAATCISLVVEYLPCVLEDAKDTKAREALCLATDLGGYASVVPGDPDESALYERVVTGDEDDLMPPPSTGKTLDAGQKEILRRWIEQGAPWAPHWAFTAPQRPAVPRLEDDRWSRNAIDHFVLSGLRERGLKPSPAAARATLIRRLSLDLTGLPTAELHREGEQTALHHRYEGRGGRRGTSLHLPRRRRRIHLAHPLRL